VLTKRQIHVLQLVIQLYCEIGEPIGSKTLMEKGDLNVSSATLRNEMMQLESLGFLEKFHTSSGRLPSTSGYRYYIDHILPTEDSEKPFDRMVFLADWFDQQSSDHAEFALRTADLLSQLSHFTTVLVGTKLDEPSIDNVKLIAVDSDKLLLIVLLDNGTIKQRLAVFKESFDNKTIQLAEKQLQVLLINHSTRVGQQNIKVWLSSMNMADEQSLTRLIKQLYHYFSIASDDYIHISGRQHILDSSDDISRIKRVYRLLEDEEELTQLVAINQPLQVKIGKEIGLADLTDFSVISARYHLNETEDALMAVIGPVNMPYSQLITMMRFIENHFNDKQ